MTKLLRLSDLITRCLAFLIFCSIISGVASAQNPLEKQWDYSYGGGDGDFLYQLLPTPDGGFLAAGISQSDLSFEKSENNWDPSTFPTYDCWLIKCDSDGIKQWDKTLGGSDDDFFFSIINTSDGGYLMTTTTRSPQSGNISQAPIGVFDLWIVKLSNGGVIEWDKRFGGNGGTGGSHVVELPSGGYLIGGYTDAPQGGDISEPSYGSADYWILRVDASGNKLWDKRYGGSDSESISKIFRTADGGFLLAGGSVSDASGVKTQDNYVSGMLDFWFVKTDSLGNYQWDKVLGSLDNDYGMDMLQTQDGHYLIASFSFSGVGGDKTEPTHGVDDLWMLKTDTQMNLIWDHSIGGADNDDDFGNIFETSEGNYLVSGTSYSTPGTWKSELNNGPENTWVVMVDPNGNKIWDKTILTGYTHSEAGFAVQLKSGCYLFANDGDSFTEQEKTDQSWGFDYWCIKFCDTTMQQPTSQTPVSALSASSTGVCQKYCTSFFDSSTNNPTSWEWNFPGGLPATSTLQNPTNICYDDAGFFDVTLITCNQYGCDTLTLTNYIEVYPTPPAPVITQNGNILTASTSESYQWQFNGADIPGATNQSFTITQSGTYIVTVTDTNDCNNFAELTVETVGIDIISENLSLCIYPNPANKVLHVELMNVPAGSIAIQIKNAFGQVVFSTLKEITGENDLMVIPLDAFPKGIYFLEASINNSPIIEKLMVE